MCYLFVFWFGAIETESSCVAQAGLELTVCYNIPGIPLPQPFEGKDLRDVPLYSALENVYNAFQQIDFVS